MIYLVKKTINSDTIYLGQVQISSVNLLERNADGRLYAPFVIGSRSILFQPNKEGLSVDLLNKKVSHYPILNFSRDDRCFKSKILVANPYCIGDFLSECGFSSSLSREDLAKAKKYLDLLTKIKLLEHKVSFWDIKNYKKANSYEIYRESLRMPLKALQIIVDDSSFKPLKLEKNCLNSKTIV